MNGYLWCPLAQQSTCWPPGSLGTFSSSVPASYPKLLQPVYCLCTSFLFLCNPAYLAIAVLVLSSVVLSYPPPHLVPLTLSPFAHILFFSLIPLSPIPSQSQVQSTTTFSPLLSLPRDYQTLPDASGCIFPHIYNKTFLSSIPWSCHVLSKWFRYVKNEKWDSFPSYAFVILRLQKFRVLTLINSSDTLLI